MSPGKCRGLWPWLAVVLQIACLQVCANNCSEDLVNNNVIITVFGQTGEKSDAHAEDGKVTECGLDDCPDNQKNVAQWILSTILRSMLFDEKRQGKPEDDDGMDLGDKPPLVRASLIPPFLEDKWVLVGKDQLSPFFRTSFRFQFQNLDAASAGKAAMNLCVHYKRSEEELLKGIQRALATFGMRPWEAAARAADKGLSLSSFIHLSSSVGSPGCGFFVGVGCGWDAQERADTRDGAFFLPPCPGNSRRKRDDLSKPWECKCLPGYSGSITYVFLQDRERNEYSGKCELQEGFCKGNYTMRLENGEPARGLLGEVARADCPDGYESTGTGKCISAEDRGVWSPSKLCKEKIPPKCTHDFDSPLARNVEVSKGCDNCRAGQECDCNVKCEEGTERYGGGTEDGRGCKKENLHMDPPPLCLPKPTCRNVTVPTVTEVEKCSKATDKAECLGYTEANKPCCYLKSGTCAAKESSAIVWDQPPEDCAPPPASTLQDLPICETKCKNRFIGGKNIEHTGCDDCTTAMSTEECLCNVTCHKPAKVPPSTDTEAYPPEGQKRCLARASSVSFEAPPVCLQACHHPGDDSGTLDVSQCKVTEEGSECFPGISGCACQVSCAEGLRQVGGGQSGSKFSCGVDGSFTGLPVCRPLCEQPDDQKGLLDTSACTSCIAGDDNCDCQLKCAGGQKRMGGGPEGKYVCALLTGEDLPPAGVWAVADPQQRSSLGDQGLQVPSCLAPISVEVVSATTKSPMAGVTVNVIKGKRSLGSFTTTEKGIAIIDMIGYERVTILASKEGYARAKQSFARADCVDPDAGCGVRVSISEVLKFGELNPDGCYFTANDGKQEWEMRAVLGWKVKPDDVDIWARNLDCFEDTAKRYGCGNGAKDTCARSKFYDSKVRRYEAQQCTTYKLRSQVMGIQTGVTDLVNGEPSRGTLYDNQFPKWIFFKKARAMDKMDKRFNAKSGAVEQIKTSLIRIVTIKGFSDIIDRRYCMGQACSELLNGDYVERPGQEYVVSGRETYWRGNTVVLYTCKGKGAWFLAVVTESDWEAVSKGDCQGVASTDAGVDVLDPSKVSFPHLWNPDTNEFETPESSAKGGVKRIHNPGGEKDLPWNDHHYMFLNVDQRAGFGPETISFKNVPPGVYQIAVNTYTPMPESWHMREAGASVSIYMGPGNDPMFHCRIHGQCRNASVVWNVANIDVFDGGAEVDQQGKSTGKSRYYIRVREAPGILAPIHDNGLPTEYSKGRSEPEGGEYEEYSGKRYYSPISAYDTTQLETVCHGRCEPAPGYEQCLHLPPGATFPHEDFE